MKKFERPSCEITEIELLNVIATSNEEEEPTTCVGDFGGGEF